MYPLSSNLQTLAQQSDVLPSDPLFHHELDLENVPLSTRKLEFSLRPPLFFTPMSIIFEKFFEKFAFLQDSMKAGNEREEHQSRRQLAIPTHLQTNDTEPCGSWPPSPGNPPQQNSAVQCVPSNTP